MNEERKKILEMVRDGIITIEEGDELLRVLESTAEDSERKTDNSFKSKLKEDLSRTKEELLKAKNRLKDEYEKIDMEKVKIKIKKGIDKIDGAVGKVDEAILKFGEKIIRTEFKDDEEVNITVDLTDDENISFYDSKKEKE